jgi:hypothetical protein
MTQLEWEKLAETVVHMTDDEKQRLLTLLTNSLTTNPPVGSDPLLGLMSDEPELLDAVVESAMAARERDLLRLPANG